MKSPFSYLEQYLTKYSLYTKILVFSFMLIVIYQRTVLKTPYPTGDGPEYLLTTEAFYNHGTPDVTLEDVIKFKTESEKVTKWEEVFKHEYFDQLIAFFSTNGEDHGFYYSKNGKRYSFHFFFYSLVNLPVRIIVGLFHADPMITYQLTNGMVILGTCFLLLFYNKEEEFKGGILVGIIFFFSSIFWYTNWIHTEPLTTCLVTAAMFLYLNKRYNIAMLLFAFATLQNQPLVLLYAFLSIVILIEQKFKLKVLLTLFAIGLICFIPPAFYYYHYGTISMIKATGHLDSNEVSFTRVWGFFFDLNQGAILAIPIILLAYITFIIIGCIKVFSRKTKFDLLLLTPLLLTVIVIVVASMKNWNHGQAIVNRYVTWISAVIIIHAIFLIKKYSKSRVAMSITAALALSQIVTTFYFENVNEYDWTGHHHKEIAKYMMEKWPSLYNPDPKIYIARTNRLFDFSPEASPVIYWDNSNNFCKMAIHRDRLDALLKFGVSQIQIDSILQNSRFILDWTYINKGSIPLNISWEVFQVEYRRAEIRKEIYSTKEWIKNIQEKAKQQSIPIDSMVEIDIEYILKTSPK